MAKLHTPLGVGNGLGRLSHDQLVNNVGQAFIEINGSAGPTSF